MSDVTKLREMVSEYPDTIEDLEDSIDSLSTLVTGLSAERAAIENIVLSALVSASDAYLAQKALDLTGVSCVDISCSVCTSGGYGDSNITEWAIVSGGCGGMHNVVWTDTDVSSSGESADAAQYERQQDFAEAYDHIHASLGVNGTYGIQENINNLITGRSILTNNKDKIEDVLAIYSQYT